ncbi:unnamed protein product [Agarophyton chilense]|eukprot:gb/GEZJ01000218.1/.p1 GENE.gb/GEZJ01000218.1/~~gb/GEZJ01000218.1/.p1  ORF type:complete len:1166 (-),score=164.40 gb/GEZJ01000218.1/:1575-5072(-)
MSASDIPPDVRTCAPSPSASQPSVHRPTSDQSPNPLHPHRAARLPRPRRPPSASHAARGESISLARRAAAAAKKKRERARAEFEQRGLGASLDTVLRDFVSANASTRPNVSQNKAKRQKRIKWTAQEVDALRNGVHKYGEGRWAVILRENANLFNPVRISVDLKDKWRNLSKSHKTCDNRHARATSSIANQPIAISTSAPVSSSPLNPQPSLPTSLPSNTPSILPTARASDKHTFHSLPAIQAHGSQTQRSLLNARRFTPDFIPSMADVRRANGLSQPHQIDNLPVFPYPQVAQSRPFHQSHEALRASNLTGVPLHPSEVPKHPSVELRHIPVPLRMGQRPVVNPNSVSLLVGSAPHNAAFGRSVDERNLPHVHQFLGTAAASHRTLEFMQSSRAMQTLPVTQAQHFDPVPQSYPSSAPQISRDTPGTLVAPQRVYGISRDERFQPSRVSGTLIHQRHMHCLQPMAQHLLNDSTQFRASHSLKERTACDPPNEMHPLPNDDNQSQDLSSRFPPYACGEPRLDSQRDPTGPRSGRHSVEDVVQNHGRQVNNPERSERHNMRENESGICMYQRNSATQSLDDDMHHLRSSNSETRYTHHQSEDGQYHYLRTSGNEERYGSGQGDSDSNQGRISSHSGSTFGPAGGDMNRNSLDHTGGSMHMSIGDQPALVRTGDSIHNEDSMHQVEVPREVLDNDEDDSEGEHLSHPHTDPNQSNLYHGSDEDDDQLTAHHSYGLVNPDVEGSDEDEVRDDRHTLGLPDAQHGIHLQVSLPAGSQDCFVSDRVRSPLVNQDHQHQPHYLGNIPRVEKSKTSQLGDSLQIERGGTSLGQRREGNGSNYAHRVRVENQRASTSSKVNNLRFTELRSIENSSRHGGVHRSRDEEIAHSDRQVISGVHDKDSEVRRLDSNIRERSVAREVDEFSTNGSNSDENYSTRKRDIKDESVDHGSQLLDSKSTCGMLGTRAITMNGRDGTRKSSSFAHPPNPAQKINSGNVQESILDLRSRSSFEPQKLTKKNTSNSDSSREDIPLVNSANSFRVTRIKASAQGHERTVLESRGAAERELQLSLRNRHVAPIGNDKDSIQNQGVQVHQYSHDQNSMGGDGQHRVEAVASVASLLNPASLGSSVPMKSYDHPQQTCGESGRSSKHPTLEDCTGEGDSLRRVKTELPG